MPVDFTIVLTAQEMCNSTTWPENVQQYYIQGNVQKYLQDGKCTKLTGREMCNSTNRTGKYAIVLPGLEMCNSTNRSGNVQ